MEYLPHIHADLELIWVCSGRLEVQVSGQVEEMGAGDAALIWPNQVHAYHTLESGEAVVHVFSSDTVESFLQAAGDRVGERAVFRCPDWIRQFCLRCYAVESEPTPLLMQAELAAVCDAYLRAVPLVPQQRQSDHLFTQILDYVDRHFHEDITLTSTAAALGYEPHYLSRYFSSMARTNFRQFVNGRRVFAARSLLRDRSMPITEVALRSGFQSIRNFNRVFVEQMGVSPSDYRAHGSPQLPEGNRILLS